MKNIIRLSYTYLRYYKKQTATLLTGIILSAALLTGIGSLFSSGRTAALENARLEYGDWHYNTRGDLPWIEEFLKNPQGTGYHLESWGFETVRKAIEEPYEIQFVYADRTYLHMTGRELKSGHYPQQENEIAMDTHTLRNLNIPEKLGSTVTLDNENFILSGIFTEMPEKLPKLQGDFMQVFVNSTLDYGKNGTFLYLKFLENGNVYSQAAAFVKRFHLDSTPFYRNNGVAPYIGAEAPSTVFSIIQTGLKDKEAGFPYIWGQLNANGLLTERVILLALSFFGAFIIYSLFQISVSKRMSQYSVMQTLGMTDLSTFGILVTEMFLVFLVGYPAGTIIGNGIACLIYQNAGKIFIPQEQTIHQGSSTQNQENAAIHLPDAGNFHIARDIIFCGAIFLFAVLFLISWQLVRRMKQMTIRQMIAKDTSKTPRSRKIHSTSHGNMTGILTRKFMFSRKSLFLGILFSLSVGSVIFLGTAYVTENTRANNELTFKADDGLGSDIQIYEASDQLSDTIPEQTIEQIKSISGLKAIHPVRFLLGEIPLNDGRFTWTEYYAELANSDTWQPDPELMEKYNGRAVKTGEDDYSLKVNIYGYDDEMLKELSPYLLEGTIDPEQMRRENSVIFKTLMDGQGNYDGIHVSPDSVIHLKTPKDTDLPAEALRFLGEDDWYQETDFKVTALVSRPLAKVDTYIDDSATDVINIIMTNEQMKAAFGISDYQNISISLNEDADAEKTSSELKNIVSGIKNCIVKDYSQQIQAQNLFLSQKMLFFYGIAAVLFGISILHIMNSMQYLVASRRHEFGILRAMGITDAGFCKMLAREGLRYGIYSSLAITVIYFVLQKILYYFMVHVYLYLHPKAFLSWMPFAAVLALNLVICILTVLVSGRNILKMNLAEEIHR